MFSELRCTTRIWREYYRWDENGSGLLILYGTGEGKTSKERERGREREDETDRSLQLLLLWEISRSSGLIYLDSEERHETGIGKWSPRHRAVQPSPVQIRTVSHAAKPNASQWASLPLPRRSSRISDARTRRKPWIPSSLASFAFRYSLPSASTVPPYRSLRLSTPSWFLRAYVRYLVICYCNSSPRHSLLMDGEICQ